MMAMRARIIQTRSVRNASSGVLRTCTPTLGYNFSARVATFTMENSMPVSEIGFQISAHPNGPGFTGMCEMGFRPLKLSPIARRPWSKHNFFFWMISTHSSYSEPEARILSGFCMGWRTFSKHRWFQRKMVRAIKTVSIQFDYGCASCAFRASGRKRSIDHLVARRKGFIHFSCEEGPQYVQDDRRSQKFALAKVAFIV